MKITSREKSLLQAFRDADEEGRVYFMKLLLCVLHGGDDFIKEIMPVRENKAAANAIIDKWWSVVQDKCAQQPKLG